MKNFCKLLLSILVVVGCTGTTQPIDTAGLAEASKSLNHVHVRPVLSGVSKLFSTGFTIDDAAKVSDQIDRLRLRQSSIWEFSVTSHSGRPARLVIAAYKSNLDAPELYFYSSPEVVDQIAYKLVFLP